MHDESFVEGAGQCKCGGSLQCLDNPPTNDSVVTCKVCGEKIGTYRDVNDQIRKVTLQGAIAMRDAALADFKRGIKRIGRKLR